MPEAETQLAAVLGAGESVHEVRLYDFYIYIEADSPVTPEEFRTYSWDFSASGAASWTRPLPPDGAGRHCSLRLRRDRPRIAAGAEGGGPLGPCDAERQDHLDLGEEIDGGHRPAGAAVDGRDDGRETARPAASSPMPPARS